MPVVGEGRKQSAENINLSGCDTAMRNKKEYKLRIAVYILEKMYKCAIVILIIILIDNYWTREYNFI